MKNKTESIAKIQRININYNDFFKEDSDFRKKISSKENSKQKTISSGFTIIDKIIGGWTLGDIVVIGARPLMGKTAFMQSNLFNIAVRQNIPAAVFTLEFGKTQFSNRLVISETGFPIEYFGSGEKALCLENAVNSLNNSPIFIDDTPILDMNIFKEKLSDLVLHQKLKIVFIDYLQLIEVQVVNNNNQEIILKTLKYLAKKFNITIIALSQLNRWENEYENTERLPQISDLPSNYIEKNADVILFIHRQRYALNDAESDNCAKLIVAKSNHPIILPMVFDDKNLIFKDILGELK